MDERKSVEQLGLARRTSPHYVVPEDKGDELPPNCVRMEFVGRANPFMTCRILSLMGSLKVHFGIKARIHSLGAETASAWLSLENPGDTQRLYDAALGRRFDREAYIYSIPKVDFLSLPDQPQIRYHSRSFNCRPVAG